MPAAGKRQAVGFMRLLRRSTTSTTVLPVVTPEDFSRERLGSSTAAVMSKCGLVALPRGAR